MRISIVDVVISLGLFAAAVQGAAEASPGDGSGLVARGGTWKYCGGLDFRCSAKLSCCKGYSCDSKAQRCKMAIKEKCVKQSDCCSPNICRNNVCVAPPSGYKPPTTSPSTNSKTCRMMLREKCSAYSSTLCCKVGTCGSNLSCCLPRGQGTCSCSADCCEKGDICNSKGFCQAPTGKTTGGMSSSWTGSVYGQNKPEPKEKLQYSSGWTAPVYGKGKPQGKPQPGSGNNSHPGQQPGSGYSNPGQQSGPGHNNNPGKQPGSGPSTPGKQPSTGNNYPGQQGGSGHDNHYPGNNNSPGRGSPGHYPPVGHPEHNSYPPLDTSCKLVIGNQCSSTTDSLNKSGCCKVGICGDSGNCCFARDAPADSNGGCKQNSDCCNSGDICDYGVCITPPAPATCPLVLELGDPCIPQNDLLRRLISTQPTDEKCCKKGICSEGGICCLELNKTGCTSNSHCCGGNVCNDGTCEEEESIESIESEPSDPTQDPPSDPEQDPPADPPVQDPPSDPPPASDPPVVEDPPVVLISNSTLRLRRLVRKQAQLVVSANLPTAEDKALCPDGGVRYCCDMTIKGVALAHELLLSGAGVEAPAVGTVAGNQCHRPSVGEVANNVCAATAFAGAGPAMYCCSGKNIRDGDVVLECVEHNDY